MLMSLGLNVIPTKSSGEKSKVNALPKVVRFLRVLQFPFTENVDGNGRRKMDHKCVMFKSSI